MSKSHYILLVHFAGDEGGEAFFIPVHFAVSENAKIFKLFQQFIVFQNPFPFEGSVFQVIQVKRFIENKTTGFKSFADTGEQPTIQKIKTQDEIEGIFRELKIVQIRDPGFDGKIFFPGQSLMLIGKSAR